MPELSRFYGIVIRMFAEAGAPHHVAHFHAYYQGQVGVFSIMPVEMIAGALPGKQRRLVEAWAELSGGTGGRLAKSSGRAPANAD